MNPLAIALEGIGFGVLLVALEGLVPVSAPVEPPEQFAASGGGQLSVADVRAWKKRLEGEASTAVQVSELLEQGRVADARELLAAKRKTRRADEEQAEANYILGAKT